MDDLDDAIATTEQVIESISVDHPDRLNSLRITLQRFERIESMDDLDDAIMRNQ